MGNYINELSFLENRKTFDFRTIQNTEQFTVC